MKRIIDKRKVAVHALAWVAAFFINLILIQDYAIDTAETLVSWLLYLLIFYINYLFLIPTLWRRSRIVLYVFSALTLLGLSFVAIRHYSAHSIERKASALVDELGHYEDIRESFEQKRMQDRNRRQERERQRQLEEERMHRTAPPQDSADSVRLPGADSLAPIAVQGAVVPTDSLAPAAADSLSVAAPKVPDEEEIVFTPREEAYAQLRREYDRARNMERSINRAGYNPFDPFNMRFVYALVFFYMASVVVFFIEQSARNERRRRELEQEKATAELAYLKQQINPHFLFNTLNAIYSYTIGASDPAADAVLKLSSILRYMLYQTGQDQVPLADELTVMNDYIELQKLRLTGKTTVEVRIGGDTRSRQIEPMLLIPIVENAFKFGVDSVEPSFIRIELDVEGDRLTFRTTNRIVHRGSGDRSRSGIGLRNIRRRLDLSYGTENYAFETGEKEGIFTVVLKLHLR
jgi:sensor histidine kinase YesM